MIHILKQKSLKNALSELAGFYAIMDKVMQNDALRFENHDHMDVLCLHIHRNENRDHRDAVYIFHYPHHLWIISEQDEEFALQMKKLSALDQHHWSLEKVIYCIIDQFLREESYRLDQIQKEILHLEDIVITNHGNDHITKEIIQLRKRLLRQERSYEQLEDAMEKLLLNENELLQQQELRSFRLLLGHCERLSGRVSSLQSYVTEIREAYQAEVDINLNVTMRIFTVLSAVFLPLTLIAGWYGMNLKMPEYEVSYGYPLVIVASITITVCLLIYFKRHRWF